MRISNENIQSAATDMAQSFNMRAIYLGHIAQYAIQLVFTGAPVGTFKLQCSNDAGKPNAESKAEQSASVVNWTDIASSSSAISVAGNITWNAENVGYLWVRVVYTRTSGTGSVTVANANMKGV